MVQITKANFTGALQGNRGSSPIVGDPAGLQEAETINKAVGAGAQLMQEIKETHDNMEFQSVLSEAQLHLATLVDERSARTHNEDGTSAHTTLDSDISSIGKEVSNAARNKITSIAGRTKFDAVFGNNINKSRIAGLATARAQGIQYAQGEFSTALDNISKQAANPSNRNQLEDIVNQGFALIDSAAQGGLITTTNVPKLKTALSEGAHESVLRQVINEDPLSAQAILTQSAKDLGVNPETRITLQKLATETLTSRRSVKNTLETQRANVANASIDTFVNASLTTIKDGGLEGQPDGIGTSDVEAMESVIDNLRYNESFEDVLDPIERAAIINRNVVAAKYADDQKVKLRNAFRTRNIEARNKQDKIARHNKDMARGITLKPEDATFMYRESITAASTPAEKMNKAVSFGQPQADLQNNIVQAVAAGDVAALSNFVDAQGTTQAGFLAVYEKLRQENPRILKGIGKKDTMKLSYLSNAVGAGVSMENALEVVGKFDLVSDSLRESRLREYNKGKDSKDLREYIEDRAINKIAGVTYGKENATPELRSAIALLGEEMYAIHDDKNDAADAVAMLLQDAGETAFPVRDQVWYGYDKKLMTVTPEKHMGWNKRETQLGISKMRKDLTPWASANGIDPDKIFIESDERTTSAFKKKSWAIYGRTENGQDVKANVRYIPDDQKALQEESRDQTYKENKANDEELADWRNRWGLDNDGFTASTHDKDGKIIPKKVQEEDQKNLKDIQAVQKKVFKSRVDAITGPTPQKPNLLVVGKGPDAFRVPLPRQAGELFDDAVTAVEDVGLSITEAIDMSIRAGKKALDTAVPKAARFLNKYFFRAIAGDADAAATRGFAPQEAMSLSDIMTNYGQIVANEPQLAAELFDDSQEDRGDETEMEPDFVDGSVNTTGKTPQQVQDDHMASMMQETRHLTAASNPMFSNRLEEVQFDAALRLARENVVAPEQIFQHASAMKWIESKKPSERTGPEHVYYRNAKFTEERHKASIGRDSLYLFPEIHNRVTSDPLLNRIYQAESYRQRVYGDSLGNQTVGIGFHIGAKNTEAATRTINWLNRTNGPSGGTIYSLEALRSGVQTMGPDDAVKVLEHQVREAEKESIGVLKRGASNLQVGQQKVVTDLVFQNGVGAPKRTVNGKEEKATGLWGYTKFIRAIKSNKLMDAPIEIIDSAAGRSQTPLRYAAHYRDFVMTGRYTPQQKQKLKEKALKFYENNKVTNGDKDYTKDAIDIIKEIQ